MIKIHGLILSPFVRKVMAVAELKSIPYKNVKVFPGTKTADFLSMSPLGKIPALEDESYALVILRLFVNTLMKNILIRLFVQHR